MLKYFPTVFAFISIALNAETIDVKLDSTLSHTCIVVCNIDKELHFYRDILGFKIVDVGIRSGKEAEDIYGLPGVKTHIYRALSPNGHFFVELLQFLNPQTNVKSDKKQVNNPGFNHFGIEVNNVDETYEVLKKAGIETVSKPIFMKESRAKVFYAYDPEGNRVEFFKPNVSP